MTINIEAIREGYDLVGDPADVDADRLFAALAYITLYPQDWDQGTWATKTTCGTSFCLAGHVVVQAGDHIDWERDVQRYVDDVIGFTFNANYTTDGVLIEDRATALLGITERAAEALFSAGNDLEELWTLAHVITNGAIAIPAQFTEYAQQMSDDCERGWRDE